MGLAVKVGTITREDPVLRFSKTGKAYCKFSIKEVKPYGADESFEGQFYQVTCFGTLAEHIANCLKGDRVFVYGEASIENYTKKDGTPGSSKVIKANYAGPEITFCGADIHRSTRESRGLPPRPPTQYETEEEPF